MMIPMNPMAVMALQSTTADEITDLSYRIREWEYLEIHLHHVEKSFKPFWAKVQLIETPDDLRTQQQTLIGLWTYCQDIDIVELSSFVQYLGHIHLPAEAADANYPELRENIAALVAIATDIQYALLQCSRDDLKKQAEAFNKTLHGQLANPRIMKQHELDQLCEVAYRLRMQLNQNFDELKGVLVQLVQSLQEISSQLRQLKDQLAKARVRVPQQSNQVLSGVETFIDQTLSHLSTSIMPQFVDARPSLQKVIDEVSARSYRLREWEHLETYLQKIFRSFNLYASKLQQAQSNWAIHAPTLIEWWTICRDTDIPELKGFVHNLKHIHEPFDSDIATNYPDLCAGITELVNIGGIIYEALINSSFKEVLEQSYSFQTILTGQLTTRRTAMNEEVEQLCQAVHDLHEQLISAVMSEKQAA